MGETTVTKPEGMEAALPETVAADSGHAPRRRLRTPRRPRFWFEILLIAVSYWTYSLVRNAVPEQKTEALHNADWIWQVEHQLGIAVEKSVNHAVNSVHWLIVGMNYYYATLHFIVTLGVLVWLYRRHPGRYAATRLVLFATTAVALVGYYLYPLAPPRLMNGGGFVDTVMVHQTWGSMASGDLKHMSNQYAAMPSMHIGWSLWCGLTIAALATIPWVRVLGLLYPALTLVVIVATANHFWLDAVGGVLCLAFGFTVARLWYGKLPYALPRTVPAQAPHPRAPRPTAAPATTGRPAARTPGAGRPAGGGPEAGRAAGRGTDAGRLAGRGAEAGGAAGRGAEAGRGAGRGPEAGGAAGRGPEAGRRTRPEARGPEAGHAAAAGGPEPERVAVRRREAGAHGRTV